MTSLYTAPTHSGDGSSCRSNSKLHLQSAVFPQRRQPSALAWRCLSARHSHNIARVFMCLCTACACVCLSVCLSGYPSDSPSLSLLPSPIPVSTVLQTAAVSHGHRRSYLVIMPPPPSGGGIKRYFCLTSVEYIGPDSRTERPRKTKIDTEVANVTRDSDTTFKVKRSKVNLLLMS